jgi:hypothetical protein
MNKTQNIGKWVAAVASFIAVACVVGLVVMPSTTYQCPVTDQPCSTKSPQTEINVLPNLTNNANQQDPSHPTLGTGIFESARISITEAETTTNTSSLNIKRRNFRSTNCKAAEEKFEEAVNEIKSQMQKILTAITSSITIPETARYEAKFILSVASKQALTPHRQ